MGRKLSTACSFVTARVTREHRQHAPDMREWDRVIIGSKRSSPIWSVTADTVAELAARGRWKTANETFNLLNNNGYKSRTQFRPRQGNPRLSPGDCREAVIARGATYRCFEHLRTVAANSCSRPETVWTARSPPTCGRLDRKSVRKWVWPSLDREQPPGKIPTQWIWNHWLICLPDMAQLICRKPVSQA